jgi:pimeloyl-ACP methyl ester carboxylesterase
MDVVGRGASDWLEHKEDYGFGQYLSDAASLLALVAHEKRAGPLAKLIRRPAPQRSPFIDWVGTSMGGLVGMMLAARSNSPIRRLVLNDVGPFISWQALARLKKLHRRTERFGDLSEVQEYIRDVCAEFGPLSEEQWAHVAQHSVQPSEDGGYELAWDPAILNALRIKTPDRIAFGNEFLLGFDLWPIWYAVRCPTLVLRGSKSAVLSTATAKRMRKSGPRAKVIDIEGVGHAPWLMSEDQIKIVQDFLLLPGDPT